MPKYHKEIKTIYQGKEMWVQVDPQKLQETGEIRTIGEPVVADASITKCDRNGFEITILLICSMYSTNWVVKSTRCSST